MNMNLSKPQEIVKDTEDGTLWSVESPRVRHDLVTERHNNNIVKYYSAIK